MKKLLLLLLLFTGWAEAQTCAERFKFNPTPFAFETVSVSTSAIGLTATTYNPGQGSANAVLAMLSTETDTIRFRLDGTAPTSSVGHQIFSGSFFYICAGDLSKLTMIRSGASDVAVSVTY